MSNFLEEKSHTISASAHRQIARLESQNSPQFGQSEFPLISAMSESIFRKNSEISEKFSETESTFLK